MTFPIYLPKGTTLLLGVVAAHDSPLAQEVIDDMLAHVMACRWMPLMPNAITNDCLVAPPERHNVHVELRWIQL